MGITRNELMDGFLRLALLSGVVAATLLACGPGSTGPATPSATTAHILTVQHVPPIDATVEVDDFASVVAAIDPGEVPQLPVDESTALNATGILVLDSATAGDLTDGDLLVLWTSGSCNKTPKLSITGSGSALHLTLDRGPWSAPACDLNLIGLGLVIHPSTPLHATDIQTSVTSR